MNFFSPAEVAKNYIATGKSKVNLSISKMLILSILAGAFIGFGGVGCTTVAVSIPYASLGKFIGACIFPGGLTMVLIAGSELFTGNCLLTIPLLEKEIKFSGMIRNWVFVYIGNLIGGLLVGAGVAFSHQPSLFNNGMAVSVISTAVAKTSMTFSSTHSPISQTSLFSPFPHRPVTGGKNNVNGCLCDMLPKEIFSSPNPHRTDLT